jgi:hypothetical protein
MKGYTQLQHVKVMTKMDIKRSGDNSKQKQHDSDRENGSKLYFLQRDKISKITLLFLFYLREVRQEVLFDVPAFLLPHQGVV